MSAWITREIEIYGAALTVTPDPNALGAVATLSRRRNSIAARNKTVAGCLETIETMLKLEAEAE